MLDWLRAFGVSLAFDLGRYVLVAVPAFVVGWVLFGERLRRRWLRPAPPTADSIRREVLSSLRTALVFALVGVGVVYGTRAHVFRIYWDARHGIAWPIASVLVLVVLQDAYFYFTHRLLHHPALFRAVHLEHHRSRHTSPFTAYAFSTWEALVHAAFVPMVTLLMPIHEVALFVFLGFMIVRNVLGHLGIELYQRGFVEHPLGATQTTTTHHALHHQHPGTNFGLYFTFWDRALGTTDPRYAERFAAVTEPQ